MGSFSELLPLGSCWAFSPGDWIDLLVLWFRCRSLPALSALQADHLIGTQGTDFNYTSPCCTYRSARKAGRVSSQWMSDSEALESVTVQLAGLEITLQARRVTAAASSTLGSSFSIVGQSEPVASGASQVPSEFGVAGPDPRIDQVLEATSASDCARVVGLFPELDSWVSKLHASDPDWTPAARIGRAYRAGVLAKLRLAGQVPGLDSLSVPFRNVYYIVLRGAPGQAPCWTLKYSIYLDRVGGRDPSRQSDFAEVSISQALPSHAEASAFLAGAHQPWPHQAK